MTRRHPFTLAEALISLIVVGGAFTLFIPAIRGTTGSFRAIQRQSACQYLADEYFSRTVIQCLSKNAPKEIETISKDFVVDFDHDTYIISTRLSSAEDDKNEEKEKFLVSLTVSASYEGMKKEDQGAVRETKLCVVLPK